MPTTKTGSKRTAKKTTRKTKEKGLADLRSGFEKKIFQYLKQASVPFKYESLYLDYVVPEKKKKYNPDFILSNGVIIEAKGKLDRLTREKMLLVKAQHPDKDIRLLFMRNNKLSKSSPTKYSEWAEKNGFKYHVSEDGHVPEEWINE